MTKKQLWCTIVIEYIFNVFGVGSWVETFTSWISDSVWKEFCPFIVYSSYIFFKVKWLLLPH